MLPIISKIENDFLEAYKSKDELKVSVLRMLKSSIKNAQIAQKNDLAENEVLQLIKREIKQRNDAVVQYEQGNRADLVEKEKSEIAILESYLPQQLSDDEVTTVIKQELSALGISSRQDFGRAMGAIMKKLQGQADGAQVSKILSSLLNND